LVVGWLSNIAKRKANAIHVIFASLKKDRTLDEFFIINPTATVFEKIDCRELNFNQVVEELDKRLEKYASENKITFINLNPIFAPQKVLKKEFTADDLHLNGSAYKLWAQEIKKYF
jgi:lysophospholipase L1-like esterase